jgi:hypothetical protein
VVKEIVFCGGLHYGVASERQRWAASRLSAVSGAELLGLQFAGDAVVAATLQPQLEEQGVRDLVLDHMAGKVAA